MNWFVRRGFLFVPVHIAGWVIFTGVVAYLVYAFLKMYNETRDVGTSLASWSFNALVAVAIYSLIAYFTSVKKVNR